MDIESKAYKYVESLEPDMVFGYGYMFYGHKVREAFLAGYNLAAATVTVPAEVVEAAEAMMNVIGVVFDNNQLTVANWVLSLAAKGKGGGK